MEKQAHKPVTTENLNLKIGDYQVCAIPTGIFGLDGGAMFGTVPKVLWQKTNPTDDANRIAMEARGLLLKGINGNKKNVLVDCGNGGDFTAKYGEKLGPKFSEIYNIEKSTISLEKSLAKAGLKLEDITDVVLTHLHFDHCGGGVTERGGKLVPTFPKAKYYVQSKNLETAKTPNIREKASYFPANYLPLIEAGVLNLIDGEREILPGISSLISNGHTQAHQMIKISDGKTTLLYCGDVVPTSTHVRLAWIMGYDLEPLKIIQEKDRVLSMAADQGWYLYFEHDPYCDAARVERNGSDFQVKQRFELQ